MRSSILAGALLGASGLVACDDGGDEPSPTQDVSVAPVYGAPADIGGSETSADAFEDDTGPDVVDQPVYGAPQP